MKKIVTLISILLPFFLQAQTAFERVYGRPSPYNDLGIEVHQTTDGGYAIGATSNIGEPNYDFWLVKTDFLGNTLWTHTYGGPYEETCRGMALTSDGGYILTGWTESFASGYEDVYLVKTDSDGNFMWQKSFGGPDDYDAGYAVKQTSDGGYIITGETGCFGAIGYDVYFVKTDSSGNLQWQKNYGYGNSNDQGRDIIETLDGGYVAVGRLNLGDVYIIKTDSMGEILWDKYYESNTNSIGGAWSVKQTSDCGYIIAATKLDINNEMWLIKTDSLGDTLWTQTLGGSGTELGYSVDITSDGGYIMAGWTQSFGSATTNVYVVKTDSLGNFQWQEVYTYYMSENYGYYVEQTSDQGYIIVGCTGSWISGGADVYLIKVAGTGIQEENITESKEFSLSILPKICRNNLEIRFNIPNSQRISLFLFDILGRNVKTVFSGKDVEQRINHMSLNTSEIPAGTYFLVLKMKNRTLRQKFVVCR